MSHSLSGYGLKQWRLKACALVLAAALSGCATPAGENVDYDPWEPMNRGLYRASYVIDGVLLKPITEVYRGVVPEQGRVMVHNAVENIASPITFGNSVLQGDPYNSFATLWRFLINSTFGIAGLFDVATEIGLTNRKTDFGQTLALYGVESGPYLFLPVLGPPGARDGLGRVFDAFMHPAMYVDDTGSSVALWATAAVDARSENYNLINDVYKSSLDPYVTFRSGYVQRRANEIKKARADRKASWKKAGFTE